MTRRSYLRRVAAPLTSGIPVLFATPQALPAEARSTANAVAAKAPKSTRSNTPIVHRTAAPATASNAKAATPPLAAPMPERAPLDAVAATPAEPEAGALPIVRRARPAVSRATVAPRARDAAMQPLSTPSPRISPPPEPGLRPRHILWPRRSISRRRRSGRPHRRCPQFSMRTPRNRRRHRRRRPRFRRQPPRTARWNR